MGKSNQNRSLYALLRVDIKLLVLGLLAVITGAAVFISASAFSGEEEVEIPVVMYHSLLQDPARQGKYVVTPAQFENDLQYLLDHGYTTILPRDLISYAQGEDLPEKPIILTFDDGYYNNYLYAYPIAQRYQCKFLLSPIGRCADAYSETGETNAYYSHATWDMLGEMAASSLVELGNHSYDLHEERSGALGAARRRGESDNDYRVRLSADLNKAQEAFRENIGSAPAVFVYPFGAMSQGSEDIVRELGFTLTFTCTERVSSVTRDPASLYGLGRFRRPSGMSPAEFFGKKMGLS